MIFNNEKSAYTPPITRKWLTVNKVIVAILICYFLYLIIPVFYGQIVSESKNTMPKDVSNCVNLKTEKEKNSCYYSVANYKRDSSICSNIVGVLEKDQCFYNLATNLQNPAVCDSMIELPKEDLLFRDACYDIAYHGGLPIMQSNYGYNFSLCSKVEDISYKRGCYKKSVLGTQDFSCNQAIGIEKDICLVVVAEYKNDQKICGFIVDKTEKNKCNDLFTIQN